MDSTLMDSDAQRTFDGLKRLVDDVRSEDLTDEDRDALAHRWLEDQEDSIWPQPKEIEFAGMKGMSFGLVDPNALGLPVHQTLAVMMFDLLCRAITEGLPGGELLVEEFLVKSGFDAARTEQIMQRVATKVPLPDPDATH